MSAVPLGSVQITFTWRTNSVKMKMYFFIYSQYALAYERRKTTLLVMQSRLIRTHIGRHFWERDEVRAWCSNRRVSSNERMLKANSIFLSILVSSYTLYLGFAMKHGQNLQPLSSSHIPVLQIPRVHLSTKLAQTNYILH